MQEDILSAPPTFKLYKDRAIYVGTFLGGPLVGGYMAAQNFSELGQSNKAKASWVFGILGTLAIVAAAYFIPGMQKIPRYIIPLIYTLITQLVIDRYQGAAIKTHFEHGGQFYTAWRAALIGLIGAVIVVAVIFALLLLFDKETLQALFP
jgi:hypothetical protein